MNFVLTIRRTMHSIYKGRDNNIRGPTRMEIYADRIRLMKSTIIKLLDFCYIPLVVSI